jgi:signal transduction histidine kinase
MAVMWWLVSLFAVAAAVCFAAAARGSRLRNADAETGLRWLLITVGVWSALQTGVLLAGTEPVAITLYVLELVVGFATIGPWLYFASAYAGRDYHRRPAYRRAAVGLYVLVTALKLTNPIHGWYFSATLRTDPVRRLVIDHGALYWGSFLLAYALTAMGFVILYRLYRDSEHSSRTLLALFAVTGVAIVPNTIARLLPTSIPALNYEPIGVALFALGTLYLVEDTFLAVEETAKRSFVQRTAGGIVVLDDEAIVREYNERAAELFPALAERGTGAPLASVAPALGGVDGGTETAFGNGDGETEAALVEVDDGEGGARTYSVTGEPLTVGDEPFGRALLVQDVTAIERQRDRLDRHEAQLNDVAGAVAHELRNSVTVTAGYLDASTSDLDAGDLESARESIGIARKRVDRLERVVEDLYTLVRYTHDVGDPEGLDFRAAIREAAVDLPAGLEVTVEGDGRITADPTRFKQLWKNAFRFAAYNDAGRVTVTLEDDGIVVSDDGRHSATDRPDMLFDHESAEPNAEAGMSLPNVRALARMEGWTVEPNPTHAEGLQYRIAAVRVDRKTPNGPTEE